MQLLDNEVEPIVLRESLRARVTVAPFSMFATFLSIFLYIPFMVFLGVDNGAIALWAVPLVLLMLARGILSANIRAKLDSLSDAAMERANRQLRFSSIANQVTVGLGIWIVQSPEPGALVIPLFMTLIMIIWSVGVLANLFSDFPTFILSMPLMIAENATFWLVQGGIGLSIGLSLLLAAVLMAMLVQRGSAIFRDSILMRFEKDQALIRVETERSNTQTALRQVQLANDSKTYFMAAASHDIKQPLHALGLLTDTLLMSDPPPSTVPILEMQKESISQMTAHFDALLDLSRFEGGHFQLNIRHFQLGPFCAGIDREIAPLCAERGLAWHMDVDDLPVATDEELLLRLIRNLLSNAVRYTQAGSVSFSAKLVGERIEFAIADTGCGIASKHQESIFQEFVRVTDNGVKSQGAGLGLSIVRKINEALELDLQLTSAPGEGTRFTFHLPQPVAAQ